MSTSPKDPLPNELGKLDKQTLIIEEIQKSLENLSVGIKLAEHADLHQKVGKILEKVNEGKNSPWEKAEVVSKFLSNLFSLAIIVTVILAVLQYNQTVKNERKSLALGVVKQVNDPEMLDRLTRLAIMNYSVSTFQPRELEKFPSNDTIMKRLENNRDQLFPQAYGEPFDLYKKTMMNEDFNYLFALLDHVSRLANLNLVDTSILSGAIYEKIDLFEEINQNWPYIMADSSAIITPSTAINEFLN